MYWFAGGAFQHVRQEWKVERANIALAEQGRAVLMDLARNLHNIRERINQACLRANRDPQSIQLLVVTKMVEHATIEELIKLGVSTFGENRVLQAKDRCERFSQAQWHLIGTLQTNKVKYCRDFAMIHSVDRWHLAQVLEEKAAQWDKQVQILIQVNIANEATKHGVTVDQALTLAERVTQECPHLNIRGLMGMAPLVQPEDTRSYFRRLADLYAELRVKIKPDVDILSMGMSNDFEVAIEEGATMVRIGSALFTEEE